MPLTDAQLTKVRVYRFCVKTGAPSIPPSFMLHTAAQAIAVDRDKHSTWEDIATDLLDGLVVRSRYYAYCINPDGAYHG